MEEEEEDVAEFDVVSGILGGGSALKSSVSPAPFGNGGIVGGSIGEVYPFVDASEGGSCGGCCGGNVGTVGDNVDVVDGLLIVDGGLSISLTMSRVVSFGPRSISTT